MNISFIKMLHKNGIRAKSKSSNIFILSLLRFSLLIILVFVFLPSYCSEPSLPEVPNRPDIAKLSEKLLIVKEIPREKINLTSTIKPKQTSGVRIKGLNSELSDYNKSNKYAQILTENNNYDEFVEKAFSLNNNQLFANLLTVAEALNLSIRFFDASNGKIIVRDKLRNLVVFHISQKESNFSNLKIFGYSSLIGKRSLSNTTAEVLEKLSEKLKK